MMFFIRTSIDVIFKKSKREPIKNKIKELSTIISIVFGFCLVAYSKNLIYHGKTAIEIQKGLKLNNMELAIPYEAIENIRLAEKRRKRGRDGSRTETYYEIEMEIDPSFLYALHKNMLDTSWFEFFFRPHFYSIQGRKIIISCDNLSINCRELMELIIIGMKKLPHVH